MCKPCLTHCTELFILLSAACCLEGGWYREYSGRLESCRSSHQPHRLMFASGWPSRIPPPPGCDLVQREQTRTRCCSQFDRREQGRCMTEGGSGREEVGLKRRAWLQSQTERWEREGFSFSSIFSFRQQHIFRNFSFVPKNAYLWNILKLKFVGLFFW